MKLGLTNEPAIQALSGGLVNTLGNIVATVGTSFNLEHDVETDRHSTIRALGAISERGRTVAMGDWIAIPYGAVAFTSTGGSWTVGSADVASYRYTLIGHTLRLNFFLTTTSVGAGASVLLLPLPPGFKAAKSAQVPFTYDDNGTLGTGIAQIQADGTSLRLFTATAANWTASANATQVTGQIDVEIQ